MPLLSQREGTDAPARDRVDSGVAPRPVVLATLSVRVDPDAERMAIESALDAGARLIIANMLWLPPYPTTLILAREYATLPHEEDLDAVRETAARAAARGITAELLRISSRRPLAALLELIEERGAGLRGARARPAAVTAVVADGGGAADPAAGRVSGVDRAGWLVDFVCVAVALVASALGMRRTSTADLGKGRLSVGRRPVRGARRGKSRQTRSGSPGFPGNALPARIRRQIGRRNPGLSTFAP